MRKTTLSTLLGIAHKWDILRRLVFVDSPHDTLLISECLVPLFELRGKLGTLLLGQLGSFSKTGLLNYIYTYVENWVLI